MKRALAVMMILSACGGAGIEETSIEQAVVVQPLADADPFDVLDLTSCIALPQPLTLQWLKQRLFYNRSCFDSWAVSVEIADCQIGNRVVNGTAVVAGDAMAKLPANGLFIRARAASAALLDIAAVAAGEYVAPRVDLGVESDDLSLAACAAPLAGGLHADLGVVVDNPVLGVVGLDGAVDMSGADGVRNLDFLLAISAEPPDGPTVQGELTGTGIERRRGELCPDAGEVRFGGSIDGAASEIVLRYVGDGQVVITLDDGETIGPFTPEPCTS